MHTISFFAEYDGHCVTFQIPTEPHRRRHVHMKTRPAESHQRKIDDILTARFEGLSLARKTHTPTSAQLSKSRKAYFVNQRKSSSGKNSKKANTQNGAAKPNNNDAELSSGSRK